LNDSFHQRVTMSNNPDQRLGRQERYLTAVTLRWQEYHAPRADWDHDHCAFCWAKFIDGSGPGVEHAGYTTLDEKHWVCKTCFGDFRERFAWKIVS